MGWLGPCIFKRHDDHECIRFLRTGLDNGNEIDRHDLAFCPATGQCQYSYAADHIEYSSSHSRLLMENPAKTFARALCALPHARPRSGLRRGTITDSFGEANRLIAFSPTLFILEGINSIHALDWSFVWWLRSPRTRSPRVVDRGSCCERGLPSITLAIFL